jgi:hypothetical protein
LHGDGLKLELIVWRVDVRRRGLMLAKELRLNRVQLETDSSGVAAKLNCEEKDRSVHDPLVEEIKKMLQSIEDC